MACLVRPGRYALFVIAMAWATLGTAGTPTPFSPPREGLVLFRGLTLIDGTDRPPRANMDVLVAGERIEKVFPDTELTPAMAARAKVIELRGRFLMPGLIDAHVHLATPPNRRQAEAVLRRDLYGGVTAVRDMTDDLRAVGDLARAGLVGEIAAPDIYHAALMAGPRFFTDPRTAQTSAGGAPGHVSWMQAVTEDTDLPLAVAQARGTFAEMARRGTVLDATLWTYSADTSGSTTLPPLPPGSCDDTVGGAITHQAYLAGVPIDAGTDNVAEAADAWPGLFHELAALAKEAGMPTSAILQSATLVGARAAGQQREMGSIEPGKLANMVVLARDPLASLDNLRSVVMTVKRGRLFARSAYVPLRDGDVTDR